MSPRNKMLRRVVNPPVIKGFKPFGGESNRESGEIIVMLLEEYEALRLCEYENCNQLQASEKMCVSRPTLTRIYASALQKIARAFVEGRQIVIEGGKVYFDSDWYHCNKCNCFFDMPEQGASVECCPLCGSSQVEGYEISNTINGTALTTN